MNPTYSDIASMIDHALLLPTLSVSALEAGLMQARSYAVASVCILPYYVPRAAFVLADSGVMTSTTIGFPHGGQAREVKVAEARRALDDGAHELDMVVNVSQVLSDGFGYVSDEVRALVEKAVADPALRVRDWKEMNKNLFSALKLEKIATFIILSLAILVASFCIICTLLLMVTEKSKEIAILKALGATDRGILRIFMAEGMIIGGIGTVFGVATGLAVSLGLRWFGVRLDPDVYYVDRLPINVDPGDFALVAVAALIITTLATLYPALAASRLRPVDGIRYE